MSAPAGAPRASGAGKGRPNILVVILDSARYDDFPGGATPIPKMRFTSALLPESLSFPCAVAPSPWTIPSHASLFTGLYPWEHGAHLKRRLKLDPSFETLPGWLGGQGYASLTASSNGFISPDFGLVNGFTSAAWGDWWERFVHLPNLTRPPNAVNLTPTLDVPRGRLWKLLEEPAKYTNRRPILLDGINRFVDRFIGREGGSYSPFISSWIEPTVGRWLAAQPAERPVFCFVNYYEAHEPYIIDPAELDGGMSRRALARLRMDRTSYLAGRWKPTGEECRELRRLYRGVVGALDERIRRLVGLFQESERWENTIFVLASDHGQAFGERGFIFHGVRLYEPVIRIPLWIRFPDGRFAGRKGRGWASLIDLAPTLLREAGAPVPSFPSAVPLDQLVEEDRPEPVFSMSDGTPAKRTLAKMVPPSVWQAWDRPFLAAYDGTTKAVLDVETDGIEAYDLANDPWEEHDISASDPPGLGMLSERLRWRRGDAFSGTEAARAPELDERLKSWGYE